MVSPAFLKDTDRLACLAGETARQHRVRYGCAPRWAFAAPGRVNLIGEHVDYNGGFVLPMAIDRHVVLTASGASEPRLRVQSSAQPEIVDIPLAPPLQPTPPAWSNYLRGVAAGFARRHPIPCGLDVLVHNDLPLGGGLSSSAALEVATCLLLEAVAGCSLSAKDRVLLCQKAEHEFAGVPCGIMDQFVVVNAQAGHLTLLDCQSFDARQVQFDDPSVEILIAHSGVAHELGKGEYAKRRADCQRAAEILGVPSLRAATLEHLARHQDQLSPIELRRARHVITEIARTQDFARAAETGDWATAGRLMYASHESLRDDYEVSCAELDVLVEIARQLGPDQGVLGARMTGGGFGGCTVTLVRTDAVPAVQAEMGKRYRQRAGIEARIFASRPASGAGPVHVQPEPD